jgi:hypothetical protein
MPRTHKPRTRRPHGKSEPIAKLDGAPRAPKRHVHGGRRAVMPADARVVGARADEATSGLVHAREPFRVPPAEAVMRTAPASLPETPR